MSYFEDNQDKIINGPSPSVLLKQNYTPRKYYTKKDGTRQYLDEMSDLHLYNALALAERKGLNWYISIFKEEISRRQRAELQ